jgi:hypothetical protein
MAKTLPPDSLPSFSEVSALIAYNPATGVLTWRSAMHSRTDLSGHPITSLNSYGYIRVRLRAGGKQFNLMAHRVAWLLHYGHWPKAFVDHVNGSRADNRVTNLREASKSQNAQNSNYAKGNYARGVSKKRERFRARIRFQGAEIVLGYFDTEAEASAAYEAARKIHHKFAPVQVLPQNNDAK